MAGLFEESGGHRRFTILTRPAGPLAAEIHDRMPVILKAEEEQAWLNPKSNPEEFSREFLESEDPALAFFSLSPKLNASFENNPELLKPTPYSVPEQLKLF